VANLRILYQNKAASATTLTSTGAVSGNYPITNLLSEVKGRVYRQQTVSNTITLTWNSAQTLGAVILAYNNLSATGQYRVQLYDDEAGGLPNRVYDSALSTAPDDLNAVYASTTPEHYRYSYGSGKTTAIYFPVVSGVRRLELTLVDTSNTSGYIEISSLLIGDYWSPTYNTEFSGLDVSWEDSSVHKRTQSGNLVTEISTISKRLEFSLSYLTPDDRTSLINIVRQYGMRQPIFVSIFPDDPDNQREQDYQIYGKLEQNPSLQHPMYTIYATQIAITEV
jgi:hypothetical protein